MDSKLLKLITLYNETSKHSNYQILPSDLKNVLPMNELEIHSRYEEERLRYIIRNVDIKDKSFCDIGANCGFFSFEMIKNGACKGELYEGNQAHAEFLRIAAEYLNLENKIKVYNQYYSFCNDKKYYDFVLLLNVLHHVGDDYGKSGTINDAKNNILCSINAMANVTDILVLQLGYNWMGDRQRCLFETGTKREMIEWLRSGVADVWSVQKIGVAEGNRTTAVYNDINIYNIERNDELGEFLNRPIFILKRV